MPREMKGVVVGKSTIFLDNHTKTQFNMSDTKTGDLVWVSYDYVHQRVATIRKRK